MNSVKLYQYKAGSKSAKALADGLGIKRLKLQGSRYRGGSDHVLINWGSSQLPALSVGRVLNQPAAVRLAANKRESFARWNDDEDVITPDNTTDREVAEGWLESGPVVCRTKLAGHSGEGIVIATTLDDMVDAPLYVKYVKKKEEYRVHVLDGNVIDAQRKMRKSDVPDDSVNWKVRNVAGGFIYGREGVALRDEAKALAVKAVEALGLDFGAVDIIWNQRADKYYVLEVNTAPGLTGTTLESYINAFKEVLSNG